MSDQLPVGQVAIAAMQHDFLPTPGNAIKVMLEVQQERFVTLQELEIEHIEKALSVFGNNKSKAAAALGVTVKTLYNKLHAYGLFDKYASAK